MLISPRASPLIEPERGWGGRGPAAFIQDSPGLNWEPATTPGIKGGGRQRETTAHLPPFTLGPEAIPRRYPGYHVGPLRSVFSSAGRGASHLRPAVPARLTPWDCGAHSPGCQLTSSRWSQQVGVWGKLPLISTKVLFEPRHLPSQERLLLGYFWRREKVLGIACPSQTQTNIGI